MTRGTTWKDIQIFYTITQMKCEYNTSYISPYYGNESGGVLVHLLLDVCSKLFCRCQEVKFKEEEKKTEKIILKIKESRKKEWLLVFLSNVTIIFPALLTIADLVCLNRRRWIFCYDNLLSYYDNYFKLIKKCMEDVCIV